MLNKDELRQMTPGDFFKLWADMREVAQEHNEKMLSLGMITKRARSSDNREVPE